MKPQTVHRRFLQILTSILLFASLSSCAAPGWGGGSKLPAPGSNASMLDGKRVIFVGCSYTNYAGTVQKTAYAITSQEERANDEGYFYQLCKVNGAEVQVTDWCYDGHELTDLFDGYCDAKKSDIGHDHLADLTDRYFDYVVLQDIVGGLGDWSPEDYLDNVKGIMQIFREANPNVKFLYTVHDGVYAVGYEDGWKESIRLIQQEGVTIVDWGTLVWDVWTGNVQVPGTKLEYNKSSFVVSNSKSDGYHPNLLSGYLNAMMTYCAITGESAVGQEYSFCIDGSMEHYSFDVDSFAHAYYMWDNAATEVNERETNFPAVFRSAVEMKGLQTLADEYLTKECKLNFDYTIVFKNERGFLWQAKRI